MIDHAGGDRMAPRGPKAVELPRPPGELAVSPALVEYLHGYEEFRPTIYTNDGVGQATIGWGHKVLPAEASRYQRRMELEEGNALLAEDLRPAEELVRRNVKVPLTQSQFDALVSLAFNAGPSAMTEGKSTLLHLVNQGDFAKAASEFPKWNKGRVNGKYQVIPGLVPRRESERKMFTDGAYDSRH
jgi:lysozyme